MGLTRVAELTVNARSDSSPIYYLSADEQEEALGFVPRIGIQWRGLLQKLINSWFRSIPDARSFNQAD
jgi:hypothetical protein